MLQITDQLIQEMTNLIVAGVNPQKIVLFGSYARGDARPGSDLDFLVIEDGPFGPGRAREDEMARLWDILFDYEVPLDFLVYSPSEVEKWQSSPNHVVAHALKDGRVLYERH